MKYIATFFLIFLCISKPTRVESYCLQPIKGPHRVFLGPELYHTKRTKKGGSEQTGWLFGGHGNYERKRHNYLYWSLDGYYAYGELNGETPSGKTLKSDITDRQIEGRLGYAFCLKNWKKFTLIPYGGYGYFDSRNDFKKPSPRQCEYFNHFYYGAAGFEASFYPFPCFEFGINFKASFMNEGKCKLKGDPDSGDVTLLIENKTQYEVDLPLRYYACWCDRNIVAIFSPFYRFRHYGGRVNWPYDFIDTKFQIYGAKILLNIVF